jgi:hypothetical protein
MRQRLIPKGPAMASGVLSVLYARLGDREKAYDYFVKSYRPNSRPWCFFLSQPTVIILFRYRCRSYASTYTLGRGTNRHGVEIQ